MPRFFILGVFSIVLCLSGCMTTTTGPKLSAEKLSNITNGKTTKAELKQIFGKPLHISHKSDDSQEIIYEFVKYHASMTKTTSEVTRLIVLLNSEGVVTKYYVDELFVDGPYFQTAADAIVATEQANRTAQQAGAAAAHQSSINATRGFK